MVFDELGIHYFDYSPALTHDDSLFICKPSGYRATCVSVVRNASIVVKALAPVSQEDSLIATERGSNGPFMQCLKPSFFFSPKMKLFIAAALIVLVCEVSGL